MYSSNGHYGHRLILNRYAGVREGTPLPGLVEHGWNHDLGAALHDIRMPEPDPFYIWSERNHRACRDAGVDHLVVPLGAPFLYLPPVEPVVPPPRSLLVMPTHGWEQNRIDHDFERYAQQTAEIAHEFGDITVCLYWLEHEHEPYRRLFEKRGWSVVTVGHRDGNPRFLHDLRDLMLRHAYVASNRVQTAAFYALHLGRKFFLHGPPTGVDQHIDRAGHLFQAWQRAEFPMLLWNGFKDETYPDLAAYELGLPFFRTPEALRDLLLWRPDQASTLERRVQALHERRRARRRAETIEAWRARLAALPIVGRFVRGR